MLTRLYIKNLALIDEVELFFEKGFNVLTGETGAGKSILIGSLGLIMGDKAQKELIRTGESYSYIEADFSVSEKLGRDVYAQIAGEQLDDNSIDTQELTSLVISLRITKDRSYSKINNITVTKTLLREITAKLLDICGQRDNMLLLQQSKQLDLIDHYGGTKISQLLAKVRKQYNSFKELQSEYNSLCLDERERNKRIDYLSYEIEEIKNVGLKPEDDNIDSRYAKMNNSVRLGDYLSKVIDELDNISYDNIYSALDYAKSIDSSLASAYDSVSSIESLTGDLRIQLSKYLGDLEFSSVEFSDLEERVNSINRLKQRYGNSIKEILQYLEKSEKELESYLNYDFELSEIKKRLIESKKALTQSSLELSELRRSVAVDLIEELKKILNQLGFLTVNIDFQFNKREHFQNDGIDEVRLMLSLNNGEPLKPLDSIASGGELSRILLGIKTIIAEKDNIETVIFDEIDTGISGKTAQMVSKLIYALSRKHQIMCITHLPVIAASSDWHFLIKKELENQRAITKVIKLDEENSILALATMISGKENNESAISNAREMKQNARK